jgi:hypothetical protein
VRVCVASLSISSLRSSCRSICLSLSIVSRRRSIFHFALRTPSPVVPRATFTPSLSPAAQPSAVIFRLYCSFRWAAGMSENAGTGYEAWRELGRDGGWGIVLFFCFMVCSLSVVSFLYALYRHIVYYPVIVSAFLRPPSRPSFPLSVCAALNVKTSCHASRIARIVYSSLSLRRRPHHHHRVPLPLSPFPPGHYVLCETVFDCVVALHRTPCFRFFLFNPLYIG